VMIWERFSFQSLIRSFSFIYFLQFREQFLHPVIANIHCQYVQALTNPIKFWQIMMKYPTFYGRYAYWVNYLDE